MGNTESTRTEHVRVEHEQDDTNRSTGNNVKEEHRPDQEPASPSSLLSSFLDHYAATVKLGLQEQECREEKDHRSANTDTRNSTMTARREVGPWTGSGSSTTDPHRHHDAAAKIQHYYATKKAQTLRTAEQEINVLYRDVLAIVADTLDTLRREDEHDEQQQQAFYNYITNHNTKVTVATTTATATATVPTTVQKKTMPTCSNYIRHNLNPEGIPLPKKNSTGIHGKGYDVENEDMLHNSLMFDSILETEHMECIREDAEQLQILKDYDIDDYSDYYDEVQQILLFHKTEEQEGSFLDDGLRELERMDFKRARDDDELVQLLIEAETQRDDEERMDEIVRLHDYTNDEEEGSSIHDCLRELERMDFARARGDDEQLQLLIEAETQRDDEERMDELVRLHDYTQIYTEEYCNNDINNTTIGTNIDKYNNGQDSNIRDSDLDELVACCEERDEKYPYNYLYDQQQHNAINADDGAYHCSSLGRCIICMAAYRTHAFVPCGHLCVCQSCATQVTTVAPTETEQNTDNDDQEEHAQCPFCNQAVNSAIKIYLP